MPVRFTSDPPPEVVRYFDDKGLKPSFNWRDVWGQEHAYAFTVAKATKLDVLSTLRDSISKAIKDGTPYDAWAKDLEPELKRLGWWGKKPMTDPQTGDVITAQLGSPRRLKTIYWANTRTARAAGAWERAQRTKRVLPYFVYRLGPSERHRPHHAALEGVILSVDDIHLNYWFPPNGWGCKCWLRQISQAEAERLLGLTNDNGEPLYTTEMPDVPMKTYVNKRTGETAEIPEGIDPGWHTNPGLARGRTLLTRLSNRLDEAGPQAAKAAIKDLWASGTPGALLHLPERVHFPVAHSTRLARFWEIKNPTVLTPAPTIAMSNEKMVEKLESHGPKNKQPLRLSSFGLIDEICEHGLILDRGGKGLEIYHEVRGLLWVVIVGRSRAGFMHVRTMHPTSKKNLDGMLKKFRPMEQ